MMPTVTVKTARGVINDLRDIEIVAIDGIPFAQFCGNDQTLEARVRILEIVVSDFHDQLNKKESSWLTQESSSVDQTLPGKQTFLPTSSDLETSVVKDEPSTMQKTLTPVIGPE